VAVKGRVGRSVASRPGSVHPISGPTGDTMEEYELVVFGFFCVQCVLEGDVIYNVCSNMLVPPRKARIPGLRTYFDLTEYQIMTKDLHGDIRSRIEHVNAYFEHHAMFEVEIHLSHPSHISLEYLSYFPCLPALSSPAWYCACVYQGRSYRGDLEILEMFVDITVNTTALQIREGYGQLNGFGDWPHYP